MDKAYTFTPLHVDIARNSTDDFNLFHDKMKWQEVHHNPFGGPILLGFQLEMLIEGAVQQHRREHDEQQLIEDQQMHFSNYQFAFANAVRPHQNVEVLIKKSQLGETDGNRTLSNRLVVKADGKLSLMGFKKESQHPLTLADAELPDLSQLSRSTDREFLPGTDYFVKRKFMTTSNAKNFLCSSLQEQSEFINEVEGKARFPEIFPCALLSSALLEKAKLEGLDFKREPMVYSSHKISIDRRQLNRLQSNDCIHILILQRPVESLETEVECYGIINGQNLLYRALISLMPMDATQTSH